PSQFTSALMQGFTNRAGVEIPRPEVGEALLLLAQLTECDVLLRTTGGISVSHVIADDLFVGVLVGDRHHATVLLNQPGGVLGQSSHYDFFFPVPFVLPSAFDWYSKPWPDVRPRFFRAVLPSTIPPPVLRACGELFGPGIPSPLLVVCDADSDHNQDCDNRDDCDPRIRLFATHAAFPLRELRYSRAAFLQSSQRHE